MKIPQIPGRAARERAESCLRGSPWFQPIDGVMQDRLIAEGRWKRIAPGANLAMAGEETGGLFGVGTGTVHSRSSHAPADIGMTDVHAAPLWFISQTLLPGQRQLISVIAQTEATVFFIPQSRIFEVMVDHPFLRHHLFRLTAELFSKMTLAMSDLLIPDTSRRAIAVLLRVAGRRLSGNEPADLPISQQDLAGMANVSRQTIGDLLRQLEHQGLVTLGYRRITVQQPDHLRALLSLD